MLRRNIYIIPIIVALLISLFAASSFAQTIAKKSWSMNDCIIYAIKNSTEVKKKEITSSTTKIEKIAAMAAFLPSIDANSGAKFRWGRGIDPATNTYGTNSSLYNEYNLNASMTLFDGGQLINQFKQAQIAHKQGLNDIQKTRDDKAIEVMGAFLDAVYTNGSQRIAENKLKESRRTLYKAERQLELGIKGKPDVAQVKAQVAEDDYNLIHQNNLYATAILKLKSIMNMPISDPIYIDTTFQTFLPEFTIDEPEDIYRYASNFNPYAISAKLNERNTKMAYNASLGKLLPSIYLSGNIGTSFFKNISGGKETEPFRYQIKNNRGESFSATISIPIFNRLENVSSIRKSRNLWKTAQVDKEETLRKIHTDIEQAVMDVNGYAKEVIQMINKVESDSLAYSVAKRKFEEGLLNAIDLQTTSNTLMKSQITLLQKRMYYIIKERLVAYYKGDSLINEK